MAISASNIASVTPRVISSGGTDLDINGMFITQNDVIPVSEIAVSFIDPDSVGDYFGYESDEYSVASIYFAGYDNSFKKPTTIWYGRRIPSSTQAYLRGGVFTGDLEDLTAVTDGALVIEISGTEYSISGVDLSEVTSYSDAASVIADALVAAGASVTVDYSSLTEAFTITTEDVGSSMSVEYPSTPEEGTDLAALLLLYESDGAEISAGVDGMTWAENVAAIKDITDNWVSFTTIYEADDDEALTIAQWAGNQGTEYLYVPWASSEDEAIALNEVLEAADVSSTSYICLSLDIAAFVCSIGACIDWDRTNGVITYAFKSQSGLTADTTTNDEYNTRTSNNIMMYGCFATRNDTFTHLYEGGMYGDYGYIDTYINAVWLYNKMQVAMMNGFTNTGKAGYTDAGYAQAKAWLMDPINKAKKNGVIAPGLELSESQKSQLYREAGLDITAELDSNGYYLQIEDPGADARTNRESPTASIWYTYDGAFHHLDVAATVIK